MGVSINWGETEAVINCRMRVGCLSQPTEGQRYATRSQGRRHQESSQNQRGGKADARPVRCVSRGVSFQEDTTAIPSPRSLPRDLQIREGASHLVIPLTQELEPLGPFVHEDPVQVARLHRTDLNGFLTPAHYLVGADVGCGEKVVGGNEQAALLCHLRGKRGLEGGLHSPTEVGISPHCSTTSLMIRPYVLT